MHSNSLITFTLKNSDIFCSNKIVLKHVPFELINALYSVCFNKMQHTLVLILNSQGFDSTGDILFFTKLVFGERSSLFSVYSYKGLK